MRILYVCPCWPGIEEAYNSGVEPNGMPGFFFVLRELINQNNQVDLFIYTPRRVVFSQNHMKAGHWFSKVRIIGVLQLKEYRKMARIFYELLLPHEFYKRIGKILIKQNYDMIYGQGNFADSCRKIAKKYNIPFGLRKYGDDFSPLVKTCGIVLASVRSPLSALSYLTKKCFLLATNDGTEIDKLALRFRKRPPYDIYMWNNGFEDTSAVDDKYAGYTDKPFIFLCSRITWEKGLDDVIDIFAMAKEAGFHGDLLYAGTVDDPIFYDEVKEKINSHGIGDSVHYLGKVTAGQVKYLTKHSVANIIAGKNNNLNNVLIETLGYGGIALVRNTTLIDSIIHHGINGFVFSTVIECVNSIMSLDRNEYDSDSIRQEAMRTCKCQFGTWEKRAKREVDLIKRYAKKT